MPTITYKEQRIELPPNTPLRGTCVDLGIPIGCGSGMCGTCLVDVVEGEENLSKKTEGEEAMGVPEGKRLGCQCTILEGDVVVDTEF